MLGHLSRSQPNTEFRYAQAIGQDVLDLVDHLPPVRRGIVLIPRTGLPADRAEAPAEEIIQAFSHLTGRWTLQVLWALRGGPVRLGQLHRLLPRSSKKVLTQTLRLLEHEQLISRRDLSGKVRHVEYHFSPALRPELCNLLDQLQRWGDACDRHHAETSL
jgi:DNA-binding HxlR family transcriptional regulator